MNKSSLRTLGSQLGVAVAGGLVAVALTGGGLAFAQDAPESGTGVAEAIAAPNTVNSAAIINGAVTSQDIAASTIGRGDVKAGVLALWAKVDADTTPTLLGNRGATSVTHITDGAFGVTFNRSIVGCAWIATLNDEAAGSAASGEIAVEQNSSSDPNELRVRTFDSAGVQTDPESDDGFSLLVLCA
jgi:hypothetical protein